MELELVHKDTGKPVAVGETVTSFRGEAYVVNGWRQPHKAGAAGKLRVTKPGETGQHEFYVHVFGLAWAMKDVKEAG